MIGNWITYDTSVKEIVDFVEKVNLDHNYSGFKGDQKFLRDDDAQKAFSKLRSSIAGILAWRVREATNPGLSPEKQSDEQKRLLREADFAFKQSFAFCPYSPEAVYRYIDLLVNTEGRLDDAVLIANTCLKLDPYNGAIKALVDNLHAMKGRPSASPVAQLEQDYREHPDNFRAGFNLASAYFQNGQSDKTFLVLDGILANPKVDRQSLAEVANAYNQLRNLPKLENALQRLTEVEPGVPEGWYDLANLRVALGKTNEALQNLQRALELNRMRLAKDPKAPNLTVALRTNEQFKQFSGSAALTGLEATNK